MHCNRNWVNSTASMVKSDIDDYRRFTIFALIFWFPGTQKTIHVLEIQVTRKISGRGVPPPSPIIYLDTWISNIDFLYTGNQRINANMVNSVLDGNKTFCPKDVSPLVVSPLFSTLVFRPTYPSRFAPNTISSLVVTPPNIFHIGR